MFDGDIEFYTDPARQVTGNGTARLDDPEQAHTGVVAERWLTQLCSTVPGIRAALLELDVGDFSQRWTWGQIRRDDDFLDPVIRQAATTQQPFFATGDGNPNDPGAKLAVPVTILPLSEQSRLARGAIALALETDDPQQLQTAAELVSRNLGWLDLLLGAKTSATAGAFTDFDGLLAGIHGNSHCSSNCLQLATELCSQIGCDQVAIGSVDCRGTRKPALACAQIMAISGLTTFDPKRRHVRALAAAIVAHARHANDGSANRWIFDPTKIENDLPSNSALSQLGDRSHHVSICVPAPDGLIMVLVTSWRIDQPPSARQLDQLEHHAALLLPVLGAQIANQPGVIARAITRQRSLLTRMFGAGHLRSKLLGAVAVLAAVLLSTTAIEFRIAAPMQLEGSTQRALAAPFDGFVIAANATPGMSVKQGEVLVVFDVSGLELEREKWVAERAKRSREYDRALAELDHSAARVLRAQINQAQAELQLVEGKLARTHLRAPFDGVVINGDLSRSIGAPFERGDVLMELAPLDGYRVVLSVDERDVHAVKPGHRGLLSLTAMPHEKWPFVIKTVASVAAHDDGIHRFRVEAALENPSQQLRPGMQGIGKITIGEASPLHIMTRRFVGWLRLNLWARLP